MDSTNFNAGIGKLPLVHFTCLFISYSNPVKGTGNSAKKLSMSILKCTELRGFTLSWSSSKIVLDRLGLKVSEQKQKRMALLS